MRLLLARHGNTFAAGTEPYIIGRTEDLPLTGVGEDQARALAACLQHGGITPDSILCGALQRTRHTALIIAETLALPAPCVDDRLTELDYGAWSGLTTAAIKTRFGPAEYEAWESRSIMPANRGWQPDSTQLLHVLGSWIASLPLHGTVLAITSNGILRFLPRLLGIADDTLPAAELKVKTGHFCGFSRQNQVWRLDFWNADPLN